MTVFLRNGNSYIPTNERALDLHKTLPVGNFIIKVNPQTNQMYFDQVDSFEENGKIYGNTMSQSGRILNTFSEREKSTGVMLAGEKGSGKTLLARMLCIEAAKTGIPTIIVNAAYRGDQFNKLIQDLTQPAIVLFDEFEKVYSREEQEEILTLFDGVFPSKKLFIITCNDKYRLDSHMRNRPGRFFYLFEFAGVDPAFITEYCEERLNDKSHIETICRIATLFSSFNFDILKAMVEEMNRYKETPHQVLKVLNAKPFSDEGAGYFNISLVVNDIALDPDDFYPKTHRGNPVACQNIELTYYEPKVKKPKKKSLVGTVDAIEAVEEEDDDDEGYNAREFHIRPQHLKQIDATGDSYTYFLSENMKVVFTKQKSTPVDYEKMGF